MSKIASFFTRKGSAVWKWVVGKAKPIGYDYKEAAKDSLIEAKNRPFKTLFYSVLCAGGVYAYKTVPSQLDFHGTLNEASNDLILVGDEITNQESNHHVQYVYNLSAKDQLHYKWLGIFSVVYQAEYGTECRNFISQCKYSNPRWNDFHKIVVDVGFCGRWWVMEWKMVDYDINFNEFPLEFESLLHKYWWMIQKAFGRGYFAGLAAQPIKLSHYIDMEEYAEGIEVAE